MLTSVLPEYLEHPSIGGAGLLAVLGYAVVFLGIVFLMTVIIILGKVFVGIEKKKNAASVSSQEPVAVAEAPKPTAPGAAGNLKLYNVEPKTAAMIMAIVADKMGKPLNELRFISIKEVE